MLVMVSPDVVLGEVVSSLELFIDSSFEGQERAASDPLQLMLLRLKNDIIDGLAKNKLRWEAALVRHIGLTFVSTQADAVWYIDGNEKMLVDWPL